jgi:uncharacterized protein with HEPN domain
LPFRDCSAHLRDILEAINYIDTFLSGMDFNTYKADPRTRFAVERQMQVISEAAIRLGADAETIVPGPDWKGFRGMGNILRHAYHRVDDELIWNTAKDELPPIRQAILKALNTSR